MPGCHHHVYTVRTPSPTRVPTSHRRQMPPNFEPPQRRRPPPQGLDQDEVVVRISRSRSPSPTRHHPPHRQRVAVKVYQDGDDDDGQDPSPRPRIPDRHYISQTMQQLLQEQRRQTHHHHCHSHRPPCSPSPPPRCGPRREEEEGEEEEPVTLEDLVEAAFQACERARQLAPRLPEAVGAALLCSNGDVILGCSLGEGSGCSSVSAECAILRKALREGHCPPFQALVLAMDATRDPAAFPVPDKECFRHFGFLPIFLVNKNLDIHSISSAAARQAPFPPPSPSPSPAPRRRVVVQDITPPPPPQQAVRHFPSRSPLRRPLIPPQPPTPSSPRRVPGGPHSWSCAQVLDWLVRVVKLPQYVQDFANARVDGHTLFHIYSHEKTTAGRASPQSKAYHRTHHYHAFSHSSSALEDTLHVYQPAHKKRLLAEIQKLKYGGCAPSAPKKAVICPVQARPEQTGRVAVAADSKEDEDEDDTSTLQRREGSIKAAAAAAVGGGARVERYQQAAPRPSNPLKQLSRVKKVFDECAVAAPAVGVNDRALLLDGTQALSGLRALGCAASQESVREYFTRRSIGLKRRDVSFYEFLRAVLALGGAVAGGWAEALPPSTTRTTMADVIVDRKRKTSKKIKPKKAVAAPPPPPALPPSQPPPPRLSSASYSSSSYSSSSSSSSCSPSQCSVSSLSGAEDGEEDKHAVKQSRVSSIMPMPPRAPSPPPPPPPPPPPVLPAVTALLQLILPPHKPSITAVPATTVASVAAAAPVAAVPRALAPLPLPAAPPSTETRSNIPPASAPQQQVPLPLPSSLKKATLIPPLSKVTVSLPTAMTLTPTQQEEVPAPSKAEEPTPAAPSSSPPPPAQEVQTRQPPSPPSSLPHGQQMSNSNARRRSSSSTSSSCSSSSSYSAPRPVAQTLQRPSPPSIASLSTTSTVTSIEKQPLSQQQQTQQQQQQPKTPNHHTRGGSGQSESVIASILSEADISELHSPAAAPSSSIPRFHSFSTSSSSSLPSPQPPPPPRSLLEVGAKIEARYKGRDRWFSGTVARVHAQEQAYDIHYDDDDVETHVPQDLVRARGTLTAQLQPPSPTSSAASSVSPSLLIFQKGDRVEARYRGRETFYAGVIGAVHAQDGAYEVHYDDGDVEERVAAALVRTVGGRG